MKKFACIAAFSLLMCSCNNSRFEEVKTENELLRKETAQKDSVIDFFISSANRIAENISLITQKEKVLGGETRSKKKFTEEDRNRILEEINGINLLIRENKVILIRSLHGSQKRILSWRALKKWCRTSTGSSKKKTRR